MEITSPCILQVPRSSSITVVGTQRRRFLTACSLGFTFGTIFTHRHVNFRLRLQNGHGKLGNECFFLTMMLSNSSWSWQSHASNGLEYLGKFVAYFRQFHRHLFPVARGALGLQCKLMPLGRIPPARLSDWPSVPFVSTMSYLEVIAPKTNQWDSNPPPFSPGLGKRAGIEPALFNKIPVIPVSHWIFTDESFSQGKGPPYSTGLEHSNGR